MDRKAIHLQQLLKIEYPEIKKEGQDLKVNLEMLIDEVIISPYVGEWVTKTVRSVIKKYGFDFEVRSSNLLDEPT